MSESARTTIPTGATAYRALRRCANFRRRRGDIRPTAAPEHGLTARRLAAEAGSVERDPAANLVVTLAGRSRSAGCGDRLAHGLGAAGGNYDGAAGIAAGLMPAAHEERRHAAAPSGCGLRGEESAWLGKPTRFPGAVRRIDAATWNAQRDSPPLRHYSGTRRGCRAQVGPPSSRHRSRLTTNCTSKGTRDARRVPVGVVTGIRATSAIWKLCRGASGHSGAVPAG